jgi:CHASE3 domain sensor protein
VVAIVLIGILGYTALQQQAESRGKTLHTLEVVAQVNETLSLAKDAETGQRGFLLTDSDEYLQPYVAARAALLDKLASLPPLVADNPEQQRRAEALRELVSQKLEELQQTIGLQRDGQKQRALAEVNSGRGKALMDQIRTLAATMLTEEQTLLSDRSAALVSAQQRSFTVIVGGLGLLLVLIVIAGFLAAREAERKETESWLRAGQAALAGALQGEQRLEVLGDHVLRFMSRQVRAMAGAFYVAEAGQTLRRVAAFALAGDVPASFGMGEGLVGEAARSDQLTQLEVESGYLRLESGLVSAPPRRVLLVPMAYNRRVNAVLELALAHVPGAAQLDLLDRSRGTVGSAVVG